MCVCVCVHVCVYVHVWMYMYVCTCMHVHVFMYMYVCTCMYVFTCMHVPYMYVHVDVGLCVSVCIFNRHVDASYQSTMFPRSLLSIRLRRQWCVEWVTPDGYASKS